MTTWTVEITFAEDPDHTEAVATLRAPGGRLARTPELRGIGQARRNPEDRPDAGIGEEIAASRALSSLAHALLDAAASHIEHNLTRPDPDISR
jgi:hypothetical protein